MQSSKTLNLAAVSRVMLSAHILVYAPDLMSRQRMSLTRDEESCAYNCPRHWTCKLDRNGSVQVNPRALHKHWKKLRSTLQSGILQTVTGCKRRSRLHSHNLSRVQASRLSCKLVEMSLCWHKHEQTEQEEFCNINAISQCRIVRSRDNGGRVSTF